MEVSEKQSSSRRSSMSMDDDFPDEEINGMRAALQGPNPDIKAAASILTQEANQTWLNGGSSKDLEGDLWGTWSRLSWLATQTPHDAQQPLVDVIKHVQASGPLTRGDDGESPTVWGASVWSDLPILGPIMREHIDVYDTHDENRNLHAFLARLTATADDHNSGLDFSLFGMWMMREAFESEAARDRKFSDITARDIDAALVWLVYAGDRLVKDSAKPGGRTFDRRLGWPGDGYRDKEWRGLCLDRWRLWQETLEALKATATHNADKELLDKAVEFSRKCKN